MLWKKQLLSEKEMVLLPRESNVVVSVASTFQQSKLPSSNMTFKEVLSVWKSVLLEDFCTDVETQTEISIINREGKIAISVYSAFGNSLNTWFHSFHNKVC